MKKEIQDSLNGLGLDEKVEVKEANLSMSQLIENCYRPTECLKACRNCENFGKIWCCPPFTDDFVEIYKNHKVKIIVTKIDFDGSQTPLENKLDIYSDVCSTIHQTLLQKERGMSGIALSFVGNCTFCPTGTCTRPQCLPCRHTEKARRSLEGVGFDVGLILKKYFNMKLDWSNKDKEYSYLTFVAAFIYQ